MAAPGRSATPRVSVVIPTFNEAANLRWVLSRLPDLVSEVVLVDGGSDDGTVEVARELRPDAVILTHPRRGKGNALATGFAAARGEVIVMLDADGSADPLEIPRFVDVLMGGADFAKGTRFARGGGSDDITRFRRLGNSCLVQFVNWLYGTQYSDLCYGLNAFWSHCLSEVAPDCDGFEVETFMTLRAAKAGLKIREVGSYEYRRRAGLSKLHSVRDGARILRTIVRERVTTSQPAIEASAISPVIEVSGTRVREMAGGRGGPRPFRVGLVNNMPDAAFADTDDQFSGLLSGDPHGQPVVVSRYALRGIARGAGTEAFMAARGYRLVESLYRSEVDALVVTGTEPVQAELGSEPYWGELSDLFRWGLANTQSMMLSCLAAHAAIELLESIPREPLERKCLGICSSRALPGVPLLAGLPQTVPLPHSHWNSVPLDRLLERGYQPLLSSGQDWTLLSRTVGSCQLLLCQGHPEYDRLTLLREFRRDWRRFHEGISEHRPQSPQGYLDEEGSRQLRALEAAAASGPDPDRAHAFPFQTLADHIVTNWRGHSERLYRNWIGSLTPSANIEAALAMAPGATWEIR